MSIFTEKHTSSEFAEMINATTENLRDWRRRGLDIGLGAAVDGRKRYSDYDLFEVELMRQLNVDFIDGMRDAIKIARWVAPTILRRLNISPEGHPFDGWSYVAGDRDKRFYVINGLDQARMVNDLMEVTTKWENCIGFKVIDLHAVCNRMAPWVAAELGEYRD